MIPAPRASQAATAGTRTHGPAPASRARAPLRRSAKREGAAPMGLRPGQSHRKGGRGRDTKGAEEGSGGGGGKQRPLPSMPPRVGQKGGPGRGPSRAFPGVRLVLPAPDAPPPARGAAAEVAAAVSHAWPPTQSPVWAEPGCSRRSSAWVRACPGGLRDAAAARGALSLPA